MGIEVVIEVVITGVINLIAVSDVRSVCDTSLDLFWQLKEVDIYKP